MSTSSASVAKGQVTVTCIVTPENFAGWFKGSTRISQDSNAKIYVKADSANQYSLVFKEVVASEGGVYVCKGSTGDTKSFTLNVNCK